MTDERKDNNKIIRKEASSTSIRDNRFRSLIHSLEDAEELAEIIINSETYSKNFEHLVEIKDENGKTLTDESGNAIKRLVKNKHDVIAAITLGSELGITPMASIVLGKRLDAKAYTKVMRGRKLGLDPMTSIDMIYVIDTQSGPMVSTGVNVITGVLLKNHIKFKYTKDFEPIYEYTNSATKEVVDYDSEKHVIITKNLTVEFLKAAKAQGKTFVHKKVVNRVTTCVLSREGYDDLPITYTLQDAINAGLYKGINDEGDDVPGKPNWNNHPATMLRNRSLTIGGRLIAGDFLDGMYSNEEASEFVDFEYVKEEEDKTEDPTVE